MCVFLTTLLASAASLLFASSHAGKLPVVYQFSNLTWLENIAAIRNGSLLVTVIGRPEVHIVNPLVSPSATSLAATIPAVNADSGITELSDDVFAAAVGNSTTDNAPVPGSFSVWSIDLTSRHAAAKVEKVADIPGVGMINGMAAVDKRTLLLADSWMGNIASLDVKSGKSNI
ncbi:hypothetical protein E8E12_011212 [Didymella heteroderae]|uniref:Uncharacterized protein n=1 Tax=Didymella heteroderae TaxID=1769908 RepID=A0A9P4WZH2_9PLEO|nr:hypothetical protein E8E12_011212 [Didymella heteroderae]